MGRRGGARRSLALLPLACLALLLDAVGGRSTLTSLPLLMDNVEVTGTRRGPEAP